MDRTPPLFTPTGDALSLGQLRNVFAFDHDLNKRWGREGLASEQSREPLLHLARLSDNGRITNF